MRTNVSSTTVTTVGHDILCVYGGDTKVWIAYTPHCPPLLPSPHPRPRLLTPIITASFENLESDFQQENRGFHPPLIGHV